MQENPMMDKLRDIVTVLNDRGDFAMADWVLMAKVRIAQLEMNVDSAPKLMPAEPVEWPPTPGWWFVEYQVSGLLLTSFVRARIVPSRPERLGIYLDGKRRFKLDEARFLPAFIRTFPPREKPDGT